MYRVSSSRIPNLYCIPGGLGLQDPVGFVGAGESSKTPSFFQRFLTSAQWTNTVAHGRTDLGVLRPAHQASNQHGDVHVGCNPDNRP